MVTRRVVARRVRHGDTQSGGMQGALFREGRIASRDRAHPKCAFPRRRWSRMRFSVTSRPQSASFRRVRFSLPGQTWSCLTEKRILGGRPHGKAHSGRLGSRESAFCDSQIAQTALFRHIAVLEAWGATTRQAAGHYQKWLNWENAFEQPPARLRGGLLQDLQIWFGV